VALVRSEAELLTGVQRAEGFQRAFEAVMFSRADITVELERWNKEVQDALNSLEPQSLTGPTQACPLTCARQGGAESESLP
jgi:hypothetical protein